MDGQELAAPDEQPKKLKRLTRKQERLARARVKNPNATLAEIGIKAGYVSAKNSTWRDINKPHVKARIRELLEASPATSIIGLHKKIKEGLNATETKFFQLEGHVTETHDCIDYGTRHKYLSTALELHGATDRADSGVINNFFTKEAIEAFVEAFRRQPPLSNGHAP